MFATGVDGWLQVWLNNDMTENEKITDPVTGWTYTPEAWAQRRDYLRRYNEQLERQMEDEAS
jgi:hypothetical protein